MDLRNYQNSELTLSSSINSRSILLPIIIVREPAGSNRCKGAFIFVGKLIFMKLNEAVMTNDYLGSCSVIIGIMIL